MRNFGIGISAPGHNRIIHFLPQKLEGYQNVPHNHTPLRIGHVREQEWPNDIAYGVYVPLRCLQVIVDANTPLGGVNSRRFEIQTPKVWRPPSGDKQSVGKESRFRQLTRL